MIRGFERAGFEDFEQLISSLSEPKVLNSVLQDLGLVSTLRFSTLRDKVQTMSKNHVEQLHELFGEELPSQGIKPKNTNAIAIEGIIN
jgi:hypothetical protein